MIASTSLRSSAFNFLNYVNTGTDPRTGLYTCTISLPALKTNFLSGPEVPLQLRFSPLNFFDTGLGLGWDLQLSQYNPADLILSLSTGETFCVTGSGPQPDIREKKLDSFHFFNDGQDIDGQYVYRVVHKSGLVEILTADSVRKIALPRYIRSPQGLHVQLNYVDYGDARLLASIDNADGTRLLSLERKTDTVTLTVHPDTAYQARFLMHLQDRQVRRIELPTGDQAAWHFKYYTQPEGGLRIIEVKNPVGAVETITYAEIPHYFPGLEGRTLARVAIHHNDPGFGSSAIETRYKYPENHHNFLGYGSNVVWRDDNLDNLYRAADNYVYSSTEQLWDVNSDSAFRSTTRTFNRFHLMTVEEIVQNDNVLLNETVYHLRPDTEFEHQPPYCQLPHTTTRTWHSRKNPEHKRAETVTTTYDDWGNLLTQINANGVTETSEWYGRAAEDGCPADPQGFVRNLKRITVTPAPSDYGQAPVLQTHYRYTEQRGLSGVTDSRWLALSEETLLQVGNEATPLQHSLLSYIDEPDNPVTHGRKLQEAVTLNGKTTTTDYAYSLASHARTGEAVLQTVSTLIGFDDASRLPEEPGIPKRSVRNVVTRQHALHHGLPLRDQDDNQQVIDYEYDSVDRLIREIAAPGTPYEAFRTFKYKLEEGQQAEQSVTDVKGVQTRTLLDGFNRVVHEELINSDPSDPQRVIRTYSARYNARGQLVQDTVYDWWTLDGTLDERPMTTRYRYDDWGQELRVRGPDDVATVTETDPIKLEQRVWRESTDIPPRISERKLIILNLFEKPVKIQQLNDEQEIVAERVFFYNGLGNCVKQFDEVGQQTFFEYDAWSRLLTTTLPDGTRVSQRYAEHTPASLPVELHVTPDNLSEKPSNAGQQEFDGLSRLKTLHVGDRILRYEYKGGHTQPSQHLTSKGKTIHYEYQLGLTSRPVGIVAEDEQVSFTYDVHSAQLLQTQSTQGRNEFDYDINGRLRGERWIDADQCWETRYTSTPAGRPLNRDEVKGLNTTYEYDKHGRVERIQQGQLRGQFCYNTLGQLRSIYTQDLGANTYVLTEREYDEHGREILRTLKPSGHPVQTLRQSYRGDNKLATRQLHEDGLLLLQEIYSYDSRGRLQQYNCLGDALPRDRYGNEITEQLFDFDALDNITHAWTRFKDGSLDEMSCDFAEHDPCQLVHVTHTHPDYVTEFPGGITLSYDEDGNLERDERGHNLKYDVQGRLLGVTNITGDSISCYRYDGYDQLLGVKHGLEPETLCFYQEDRVSRTRQGDISTHYFYSDELLMGQQTVDDETRTLLFLTDSKNSVMGESQQQVLRKAVYDAYGERCSNEVMQSPLAFNGERRDEVNGWYLLGKGYRAYNPHLRRFHSPDSFSPFGPGGFNPYVYCLSDPINYIDPTGHEALWQFTYLPRSRKIGAAGAIGLAIGLIFTVASAGTLAPAAAAITAGASAASVAAGLLTIASFAASTVSLGTGTVALFTGDPAMEAASMVTGYTAMGTGMVAFGLGRLGAAGVAGAVKSGGGGGGGSGGGLSRASSFSAPSLADDASNSLSLNTGDIPRFLPRVKVNSSRYSPPAGLSPDGASGMIPKKPSIIPPKPKNAPASPVLSRSSSARSSIIDDGLDRSKPRFWQYDDEGTTKFLSDTPPRFAGERGDLSLRSRRVRDVNIDFENSRF